MSTSLGTSSSRPTTRWKRVIETNLLTVFTIFGVFGKFPLLIIVDWFGFVQGGTALGLILKKSGQQWSQREVMYIQYPGDLFLRMLKCLIVPLLVSSISSAIGGLDLRSSKMIAFRWVCCATLITQSWLTASFQIYCLLLDYNCVRRYFGHHPRGNDPTRFRGDG